MKICTNSLVEFYCFWVITAFGLYLSDTIYIYIYIYIIVFKSYKRQAQQTGTEFRGLDTCFKRQFLTRWCLKTRFSISKFRFTTS